MGPARKLVLYGGSAIRSVAGCAPCQLLRPLDPLDKQIAPCPVVTLSLGTRLKQSSQALE